MKYVTKKGEKRIYIYIYMSRTAEFMFVARSYRHAHREWTHECTTQGRETQWFTSKLIRQGNSVQWAAPRLRSQPSSRAYWILVEGSRSFISAVGKWLFAVRDRTEERIRHTAAPEKQFHQSWRCSSCVLTHELNKLESAEFDKREQRFGAVTRISYWMRCSKSGVRQRWIQCYCQHRTPYGFCLGNPELLLLATFLSEHWCGDLFVCRLETFQIWLEQQRQESSFNI